MAPEFARQGGALGDDIGGGVGSGEGDNALLQIDEDEGGDGIEFGQGHGGVPL